MNLLIIFAVIACLCAAHGEKLEPAHGSVQTSGQRGIRRFVPKTDHEKELLKLVAEKINLLLKDADTTKLNDGQEDINSILSMVSDSSPKIQSEARIFETLAHVIADVSEQIQKRSFTRKHIPSSPKIVDVKSDMKLYGGLDVKKHAEDGKTIDVGGLKVNSEEAKKSDGEKSREVEKSVLKLMPRVVFTDSNGNEYHLVGAGGRSAGSCTGQCLRIDADSKNVLAFKTPGIGEHLILAGHSGEEYFTSGVQFCDNNKKSRNIYTAANLALLAPKDKFEKSMDSLSVQWGGNKAPEVKRENPLKEFSKDVATLFNGGGLKLPNHQEAVARTSKLKQHSRRRKHARLHTRRRRGDAHRRTMRDVANDDYYYDDVDDESLVKTAPRTSLELKLLEDLKKDKKHLEKFRQKQNSQVDMDKCKAHCEALTLGLKKAVREDAPARRKRSIENLESGGDIRPVSGKAFRIIAIEPKERDGDTKNGQGLLGEINMIQPESSPDEENRVLLKATGKPIVARQDGKIVHKLDANEEELDILPDLIPATDSDELVYFPEDDDLGDVVMEPITVKNSSQLIEIQSELANNEEEGRIDKPVGPSSAEVGSQFAEAILFRVQNTDHMKKTLGVGLKFHSPEVAAEPLPQHGPHYASTLQILLRTLMLNVEKIAEEDVQERSCITLETELQDFLDEMIDLKSHPNMPNQYTANMGPAASYSTLTLRKNELLDLLREYHSLPLQAQQHASGVKSFIEAEVNDIDKLINSRSKSGQRDRFIRNTLD